TLQRDDVVLHLEEPATFGTTINDLVERPATGAARDALEPRLIAHRRDRTPMGDARVYCRRGLGDCPAAPATASAPHGDPRGTLPGSDGAPAVRDPGLRKCVRARPRALGARHRRGGRRAAERQAGAAVL